MFWSPWNSSHPLDVQASQEHHYMCVAKLNFIEFMNADNLIWSFYCKEGKVFPVVVKLKFGVSYYPRDINKIKPISEITR